MIPYYEERISEELTQYTTISLYVAGFILLMLLVGISSAIFLHFQIFGRYLKIIEAISVNKDYLRRE